MANIEMTHPRPYVGITMGSPHTKLCNTIVGGAVKCAMATAGHTFCYDESSALIQAVCPDIMNNWKMTRRMKIFQKTKRTISSLVFPRVKLFECPKAFVWGDC